ncbi:hypothetical protein [Pseudotabrizicola algicola]|uniref:Uncharacterized protein n=1 Tax=Pseudotabrizicola algicola TaxID=2709381 RepID=A0A6B3RP52_9RHOB|nr:hypothetical protein [Pseudotabrizicola algicola]NEX47850.1 hypothetical protein [Pseudotabrizicola algicola]
MNLNDLRAEIVAADAKAAFDVLVSGFSSRADFSVHAHEKGFLNSVRIWRGDDFCFAAIPNDEWVLAYIRKPELRLGRLSFEAVVAQFPDARLNKSGEITLRIRDAATAERWLSMVLTQA